MKTPNKKDIMKKWSNILGSMGMTGSQLDAALNVGIPVVDFKWIIATCFTGIRQSEHAFCLVKDNDDRENE